jgi:hypothetical protein
MVRLLNEINAAQVTSHPTCAEHLPAAGRLVPWRVEMKITWIPSNKFFLILQS